MMQRCSETCGDLRRITHDREDGEYRATMMVDRFGDDEVLLSVTEDYIETVYQACNLTLTHGEVVDLIAHLNKLIGR